MPCCAFSFAHIKRRKYAPYIPGVCTNVLACGVRVIFLHGARSPWHLQVACLHLIVRTVCSVPFFHVSERSGRNRPLREALIYTPGIYLLILAMLCFLVLFNSRVLPASTSHHLACFSFHGATPSKPRTDPGRVTLTMERASYVEHCRCTSSAL